VLGNGRIYLEIEPEVSNIDPSVGTSLQGTTVPGRSTQRVHTEIEVEDGQTFAIGGLIQHTVQGTTIKVPVLGELPFLGAAFSTKSYNDLEEELLVIVTPHLVDAMACNQTPKLLPGQETRNPDDFELFLEQILEAPRGPRAVVKNGHYEPAFKGSPTMAVFPCAGSSPCSGNGCGRSGASTGCSPCGAGVMTPLTVTHPSTKPTVVEAESVAGEHGADILPPTDGEVEVDRTGAVPVGTEKK
jgi:pilus assembly protein CpaC